MSKNSVTSFNVIPPTAKEVPILISVPHCGTSFPAELADQYKQELVAAPDDTDWFVDRLYDFAPSLGFTMITANYSRWVIDLNRDPESKPLYHDGRIITALCPATDFRGVNLYKDERNEVDPLEVRRRTAQYYRPYHNKLGEILFEMKNKFGKALLWDCHSIRDVVPSIQRERFPDLILGDADEKSASSDIIRIALENLNGSGYPVSHNFPFKGGYITRTYGHPEDQVHALQLEMIKTRYMDDTQVNYHTERAEAIRKTLINTLNALKDYLSA